VKNEDLSLRPGMTATAEIATTTNENVLLAPNAALRFTPSGSGAAPQGRGMLGGLMPGPPPERDHAVKTDGHQLWILTNGRPSAIAVTVGQTNGRQTEITSGEVREGMPVITDAVSARQ
jgi:HlyD family secretion protein